MNFLAHVFLSGNNEQLILGNLIADSVKGKMIDSFDDGVKKGIQLHRLIDYYTDNHLVVKQSKARLETTYRKYAGVIVDIYYDHFLAANFPLFSQVSLSQTAHTAYNILIRNFEILPPQSKRILPFMATQNWLEGYANLHDLQRVFNGMSRRASFVSGMENAILDLKKDYQHYEKDFFDFFPDLIKYATMKREML
jgi:acyl carrier protein phosphodiesterase